MQKKDLIYEGKGKKVYSTNDENFLISEFKDDLTAFNAQKKGNEEGKGALNCKISAELFKILESSGVKTHFEKILSPNEQLVQRLQIIPIEVIVRNVATGSLSKKFGFKDGLVLDFPLVEFCLKDDDLGDPLMCFEHALLLKLATKDELNFIKQIALKVNEILVPFFRKLDLRLIDFKLEFGKNKNGEILLGDEISPDSCRFWDIHTNKKLDKDVFRQDLGEVKTAYQEVLTRIMKERK